MATIPGPTERLVIVKSYVVSIEQKTLALWANDENAKCFDKTIKALRDCVKALWDLEKNGECTKQKQFQTEPDCRDYYEQCDDGVCRIWCS
jgi:hypothetical protein